MKRGRGAASNRAPHPTSLLSFVTSSLCFGTCGPLDQPKFKSNTLTHNQLLTTNDTQNMLLTTQEPRAGSLVEADIKELDVPEKIRLALGKEALFISLATGASVCFMWGG
jgi:hypothetical protein